MAKKVDKKVKKKVRKAVANISKQIPGNPRTLAAGAVGIAAAAAGVMAAARRRQGDDMRAFHVLPQGEGWVVREENKKRAASAHDRKKDAIRAGREIASDRRPSCLVVHKADGTISRTHTYRPQS